MGKPSPETFPENKFRVFYDEEARHYRVILDGQDLSHSVAAGGIKVDFSPMQDDPDLGVPTVTLTFFAEGGVEVILRDGQVITEGGEQ